MASFVKLAAGFWDVLGTGLEWRLFKDVPGARGGLSGDQGTWTQGFQRMAVKEPRAVK